jgi:hypothetical protein
MSCIEITVFWLSMSICRPDAPPRRASSVSGGHRSARVAPEVEVALQHLERARERLRVEEEELAEALRLVRGK